MSYQVVLGSSEISRKQSIKATSYRVQTTVLELFTQRQHGTSTGSLKSTTRRQRQCHKFCLFSEQKQKPCTPFTCFNFCTFLSRYRQICHVKWPFPSFEFSFLELIPHLLIQFLGNSAGFKSETNWHNEDWKQSLCISSQTSESLTTPATITSQICILTFHLYENEDFPTFEDSVCVLSWELV